eukprot:COSAG04_NODE_521_length_13158_cov_26.145647_9_plen_96_part_00
MRRKQHGLGQLAAARQNAGVHPVPTQQTQGRDKAIPADEISDDEDVYGDPIEKHWDEEEEREISTKRDLYPGPELEEEESDAEEEEEEDGDSGGE